MGNIVPDSNVDLPLQGPGPSVWSESGQRDRIDYIGHFLCDLLVFAVLKSVVFWSMTYFFLKIVAFSAPSKGSSETRDRVSNVNNEVVRVRRNEIEEQ